MHELRSVVSARKDNSHLVGGALIFVILLQALSHTVSFDPHDGVPLRVEIRPPPQCLDRHIGFGNRSRYIIEVPLADESQKLSGIRRCGENARFENCLQFLLLGREPLGLQVHSPHVYIKSYSEAR
jgi:hypothetical protein